MSSLLRLDVAMVERGLAPSRERAKERILDGDVSVGQRVIRKPSYRISVEDAISCEGEGLVYVGRGGVKLEKALECGGYDLKGAIALDVGASTGGFTDCLLRRGAARVFALDVGRDQLHPSLKKDPRVVCLEGTDARDEETLRNALQGCLVDFCSIDLSFISFTKVLPALLPFLKPDAGVTVLIKPQFEAGREALGKRGVVRDPAVHKRVLDQACAFFDGLPLHLCGLEYSPVRGGEGNIEFLALLRCGPSENKAAFPDTAAIVATAHQALKF